MKTHSPAFLRLVDAARLRIVEVEVATVLPRLGGAGAPVLVDVREQDEWAAGHARGALFLSKGVIERDIEGLLPDLDQEIVLYCGGGYRSALAADALQQMGYRRVSSLVGGWRAWLAAQAPVEH